MRKFYIPIFWKFTFGLILVVAIFGGINISLINNNVKTELEIESEKRGRYIALNLANQIIDPIMFEDYLTVQKYLDNIKQIDSTVIYAIVSIGTKKNHFIHNFDGELPFELIFANDIDGDNTPHIAKIKLGKNKDLIVRDIAVPILSNEIGSIRVGILEESISKTISETTNNFILMIILFLVIGIISALIFSRLITNPIKEISIVADEINLDSLKDLKEKSKIIFSKQESKKFSIINDELDFLTNKFYKMINRLVDAYSELKNTYSMLLQSEKLASIGTLSSGIAHEINNPNTGIQYCIENLKKDFLNEEQKIEYLEMIEEASIKIEKVVKGLLDYSRPQVMEFEEVDLVDIIEKSLKLLSYKIEKNFIKIKIDLESEKKLVKGSNHFLEQVIVNLIMNSIDAISEKKSISNDFTGVISIKILDKNEIIELIIEDNGTGIKENDLNNIYNPFYSTKEVGKGTGLGLPITLNIINDHKGTINVESVYGEFTKFTINLLKY